MFDGTLSNANVNEIKIMRVNNIQMHYAKPKHARPKEIGNGKWQIERQAASLISKTVSSLSLY